MMNFTKILASICAVTLITCTLSSCGDKKDTTSNSNTSISEEENMNEIVMNETNVKQVGRTDLIDNTLWCALSGSGVEFLFTGKKLDMTIVGDNVATSGNEDNMCRVAIYVDGERVVDDMINEAEKSYTPVDNSEEKTVTVQVIKLSECAMSTMGIKPVVLEDGGNIAPAPAKAHKIEIIGDSITCGYGVDDEDKEHHFKTSTEDVTKSYSFKTANELDADYSMFSISGYGMISGYTDGVTKKAEQTIPQYYESLGFSYGSFAGTTPPQDEVWDFSKYQPELVIINLGTNDDSYTGSDSQKKREYIDAYKEFLQTVRKNNPDAHIMCTLGIMGSNLFSSIEEVYLEYKKETGDENISIFKFDTQNGEVDGYSADWHPTSATHDKATVALTAEIKTVMGW